MRLSSRRTPSSKTLNVGKEEGREASALKKAMSTFVICMQDIKEEQRKAICKLAIRSARLYLFAMHLLETMDILQNPKIYRKKCARATRSKVGRHATAWMQEPENTDKLAEMLAHALKAKVQEQMKDTKRKKTQSFTEDDAEDATSEDQNASDDKSTSSKASSPNKTSSKKNKDKKKTKGSKHRMSKDKRNAARSQRAAANHTSSPMPVERKSQETDPRRQRLINLSYLHHRRRKTDKLQVLQLLKPLP